MPHVFISYVHDDIDAVRRLASDLEARGVEVWLDRERLLPGVRWQEAIRRAIREGSYFLACFSSNYALRERSYMNEELVIAVEELRQRPIARTWFLPVLLDPDSVPERSIGGGETLKDLQFATLYEDWEDGIERLLLSIAPPATTSEDHETGILRYRFHLESQPVGIERGVNAGNAYTDRLAEALHEIWSADHPHSGTLPDISPTMLTQWHRRLLTGIEPEDRIGRFRFQAEISVYELWADHEGALQRQTYGGMAAEGEHHAIWDAVNEECGKFRESAKSINDGQQLSTLEAVQPCARLYQRLLTVRPFPVENDAIAYLALQAAFCRIGLEPLLYAPRAALAIDSERSDARGSLNLAFNHAVASVLRPRASLDPLVIFLATHTKPRRPTSGA